MSRPAQARVTDLVVPIARRLSSPPPGHSPLVLFMDEPQLLAGRGPFPHVPAGGQPGYPGHRRRGKLPIGVHVADGTYGEGLFGTYDAILRGTGGSVVGGDDRIARGLWPCPAAVARAVANTCAG